MGVGSDEAMAEMMSRKSENVGEDAVERADGALRVVVVIVRNGGIIVRFPSSFQDV